MVYISSTGEVLDKEPITWKTPLKMLWALLTFVIVFFLSMFSMEHLWVDSRVNRYFTGSSGYSSSSGDDRGNGPGGPGFRGGGGGGGGPGGPTRRIHTLPRSSDIGASPCAGGACGRP